MLRNPELAAVVAPAVKFCTTEIVPEGTAFDVARAVENEQLAGAMEAVLLARESDVLGEEVRVLGVGCAEWCSVLNVQNTVVRVCCTLITLDMLEQDVLDWMVLRLWQLEEWRFGTLR